MKTRIIITAAVFLVSLWPSYFVTGELLVWFEMFSTGAASRAELANDFGLGMLLMFIGIPLTILMSALFSWFAWRKLKASWVSRSA